MYVCATRWDSGDIFIGVIGVIGVIGAEDT